MRPSDDSGGEARVRSRARPGASPVNREVNCIRGQLTNRYTMLRNKGITPAKIVVFVHWLQQ